jgi:hypothetical protein
MNLSFALSGLLAISLATSTALAEVPGNTKSSRSALHGLVKITRQETTGLVKSSTVTRKIGPVKVHTTHSENLPGFSEDKRRGLSVSVGRNLVDVSSENAHGVRRHSAAVYTKGGHWLRATAAKLPVPTGGSDEATRREATVVLGRHNEAPRTVTFRTDGPPKTAKTASQ